MQGTLCNKSLLMELTGYTSEDFYRDSYEVIDIDIKRKIFD
jgi:hypothetical protein